MRPEKLQKAYWWLVRMHPFAFRAQFGDEMLWIFGEESRSGGTVRLFGDGVISLMRQWAFREPAVQRAAVEFGLLEDAPGMAPRRFVEATVGVSLLLAGVMVLLGQLGRPYPVAPCLPGPLPRLHASSIVAPHVGASPGVERRDASRAGATQVDAGVASAVRIARAQEGRGFAATAYCAQTDSR